MVGINSTIISTTGGSVELDLQYPQKVATPVIEQLIEYGETRRGWLGVRIQEVSEDIASSLGMNGASGALVVSVDDDGPAKQAGIKSGDIILKFNGVAIDTMRELPRVVAETKVGTKAEVEIWRKNKVINKSVVIER